jgi:hypothetical protein
MTSKLRFKLLALVVMLASLATVTWLDKPTSAACSPTAYDGCMGRCNDTRDSCLSSATSGFGMIGCWSSYDGCTCTCARDCFGPNADCSSPVGE